MDNPAFEQPESPSAAEIRAQEASLAEGIDNLSAAAADCCPSQVELSTIIEEHENYPDTEGVETEYVDENDGHFVPLLMKDQIATAEGNNDEHGRQQPNICSSCLKKPETRNKRTQATLDLHGIPQSLAEEANAKFYSLYEEIKNFENAFLHRYFAQDPENVPQEENSKTAVVTVEVTNSNTANFEERLKSILKAAKKCKRIIRILCNSCLKEDSEQVQELQSNSNAKCASNTVHENPSVKVNVKCETATEVHQKGDQALFEPFYFSEDKIDMVTDQVKALEIFDSVNAMNKGYQMRDFGTQTEGELTYSNRTYGYYNEKDSFVKRKRPYLATAVASSADSNFNFSSTTDASLKRGYKANPHKRGSYNFASASRYSRSWRINARYTSNTQSWRKTEPTDLGGRCKNVSFNFGTNDSSIQGTAIQNELLPKTGSSHLKNSRNYSNTRRQDIYENHSVVYTYSKSSDYGNSNLGECSSSNQESIVRSELLPEAHGNNKMIHPAKQEISGSEPKKSYADVVAFKK